MKKFARYAQYVPLMLLILGFVLVVAGWNGASEVDFIQGQIPYLISGGFVGLGLIIFGCVALVVRMVRKGQAKYLEELQALVEATERASLSGFSPNGHKADSTATASDLVRSSKKA